MAEGPTRRVIASTLSTSTLTTAGDGDYSPIAIQPDVKVLKIGGQSMFDRGRDAIYPLLDEIIANQADHKLFLLAGGGTRARHIYSLASELQLPTGVLAKLGGYVAMQNARMLQMLLAKHGGIYMLPDEFDKLPLYFRLGCIPITSGMPPFEYWEKPSARGRIPRNRTDAGVWLTAEVLGVPRAIFVKDDDGLYTDDPKKNPNATHIPRISAAELIERDLPDVVVERVVLEYLQRAKHCKEVQIINGLKPGMLTRALAGEPVGSIIYKDEGA
jgi:molybdenum storage protein